MHWSSEGDNLGEHAQVFYESCLREEAPLGSDVNALRDKISKQGYLDPRVVLAAGDPANSKYNYLDEGAFVLENLLAAFIKNDL